MGSGCMVGLVDESVAVGTGIDKLAEAAAGFWGVDDVGRVRKGSGRSSEVDIPDAPMEAFTAKFGSCVFVQGDTIGLNVDMDARSFTMLRNGTPIPSLVFENLPAKALYVAATPFHSRTKVQMLH